MPSTGRAALAVAALIACAAGTAHAQIDYRNLDDDRPVLVEDAYALERYAFELLTPYRLERGKGGTTVHAFVPELAYGVWRNTEVGLKAPMAGVDAGATDWGLAGLRAFGLYNVNTESPALPAFSLRVDATFPAGSLGGSGTHVALKLIATRSFGPSRVHFNGAYGFGDGPGPAVEAVGRWSYGAAVDRTFFRRSTLLVAEVYARREADSTRAEVNASFGLRWQWTPTLVLDAGIARGLRSGIGPEYALTLGLSRAFAVAAFMPRYRTSSPVPAGGAHEHAH